MNKHAKSRKDGSATNGKSSHSATATVSAEHGMDSMLEKLFVDQVKDIYYAEKLLAKALPKMAKSATTDELREAFEEHHAATQEHVNRLEQVFEHLGKKPQTKKCEAMEGLHKEAESIIEDTEKGTLTRDVGLIMAAQKMEHYEIATYGCLAQLANTFNLAEVATLLQQTLDEEKDADQSLTYVAENHINYEAGQEGKAAEEE